MLVGLARADSSLAIPRLSNFGWGTPRNRPLRCAAPLHTRTLTLADDDGRPRHVFIALELGLVPGNLRTAIDAELRARWPGLTSTVFCTHTHSGPSGLSDDGYFALSGPGFAPKLVAAVVQRVVACVESSIRRLAPATVELCSGLMPMGSQVAFQRSIEAHRRNPGCHARRDPEAGIDRRITVLRVVTPHSTPLGMLALFGVHGTLIHSDHEVLHGDVLGDAATSLEGAFREQSEDFVALVGLSTAGDVSPNFRPSPRGFRIGLSDDDFESSREAGRRVATRILEIAADGGLQLEGLPAVLEGTLRFDRRLDDLAPHTAWMGIDAALGTAEGPGPLAALPLASRLAHLAPHTRGEHFPKRCIVPLGPPAATPQLMRVIEGLDRLVGGRDPRVALLARLAADAALRDRPLLSHALPIQCIAWGRLGLLALPFEPTTEVGRRLVARLRPRLARHGLHDLRVLGYANAFASYLTTPEEYAAQRYEGASTFFGPRAFERVARTFEALVDGSLEPGEHELTTPWPAHLCLADEATPRLRANVGRD